VTESNFWVTVHRKLAPFGRLERIENRIGAGTGDVCYCLRFTGRAPGTGWLELKQLDGWPARAQTPISIPTLTLDQVLWLEGWAAAGGRAWLLAKIGCDLVLADPPLVRALYRGELVKTMLIDRATVYGAGRFPVMEVLRCLTR